MKNNILGIFLLILAVSGNFIAETLGCKTQKLLSGNMFAKNIVIILITYFSLGLSNSDEVVSPLINFQNALLIWVSFVIFNKMSLLFTLTAFALLTIKLVLFNYIDYYKKKGKNEDKIVQLESTYNHLFNANIGVVIVGFLLYLKKQYKEHYKNFNVVTFLFGSVKCKSM